MNKKEKDVSNSIDDSQKHEDNVQHDKNEEVVTFADES